jgi:hypothetical protein
VSFGFSNSQNFKNKKIKNAYEVPVGSQKYRKMINFEHYHLKKKPGLDK